MLDIMDSGSESAAFTPASADWAADVLLDLLDQCPKHRDNHQEEEKTARELPVMTVGSNIHIPTDSWTE